MIPPNAKRNVFDRKQFAALKYFPVWIIQENVCFWDQFWVWKYIIKVKGLHENESNFAFWERHIHA